MIFDTATERAEMLGKRAADKARDHIIAANPLPVGVTAEPIESGILLSGKRLRHRFITDPQLRNYAR